MAWVTPRTAVTGEVHTAAYLNQTRDNLNYLHDPPSIQLQQTAGQSFPNNTITAAAFNAEGWKSNIVHSNSSSNEIATILDDGVYLADVFVGWDPNVTGVRRAELRRNNSPVRSKEKDVDASGGSQVMFATLLTFEYGDNVTVAALQNSGGSLTGYVSLALTWLRGLA